MNFIVQLDSISYNEKPNKNEVVHLKSRLAKTEPKYISLSDFSKAVLSGQSFTPGILKGGAKAENWTGQQIFCVDIDNESKTAPKGEKRQAENPLTVDEVFRRCKLRGIKPALIYETFSSTPMWQKFRIVFVADHVIADGAERDMIQSAIMELFPECDTACKNRDRLFYGGKRELYSDNEAYLTADNIADLCERGKAISVAEALDKNHVRDPELDKLIKGYDFLDYIIQKYDCTVATESDNYCILNPCPICGHNDDFQFDKVNKTFHCHSSATDPKNGGSIIDFLIYKDGLTKHEAITLFKYDLCGLDPSEDMENYLSSKMLVNARQTGFKGDELPPYFVFNRRKKQFDICFPELAEYIRLHESLVDVRDASVGNKTDVYLYADGIYTPTNDIDLAGRVKHCVTDFERGRELMSKIKSEVLPDLKSDMHKVKHSDLNADEDLINFKNGLYSFKQDKLLSHTPDVLSTIQLPCKYNSSAKKHENYDKYLNDLSDGNAEIIRFLNQYAGVVISNIDGSRMKKAAILYGPGNTGKSQFLKLIQRIVGEENCGSGSLKSLEERFGTNGLLYKRLYGDPDMGFTGVNDLRIFKQITGGDAVQVEIKGGNIFPYRFKGLLCFCANALPNFGGDKGSHVYERFVPIPCNNVIHKDKQDATLLEKMFAESEAIINDRWIPAARQVIENGYRFDIPAVSVEALEQYKVDNSPVITFFTEYCKMREPGDTYSDGYTCVSIYNAFTIWYRDEYSGRTPVSKQAFRKEISDYLKLANIEKRKSKSRYYIFTLNVE